MKEQINIVAQYLSYLKPYVLNDKKNDNYNIIVLCGNNSFATIDLVGMMYNKQVKNESFPIIIVTGGIGRCTPLLHDKIILEREFWLQSQNKEYIQDLQKMQSYRNLKKINHPVNMSDIFSTQIKTNSFVNFENTIRNSTEAEIFTCILHHKFEVPYQCILIDNYSTNTGENAKNTVPIIIEISKKLYQIRKEKINIALVQDHTMLRRSLLTFSKVFKDVSNEFFNKTINLTPISHFEICYDKEYIDLLLGEMSRIQNTEDGYGPKGKKFIDDVGEIPEEVKNAVNFLEKYTSE